MNMILKHVEGHLNQVASNTESGLEAWRRIKWYFEPKLVARAGMYLGQFMALTEVASDKLVPEALGNLESLVKQYEECSGKTLDSEIKMNKVLNILPKDLRSKVRTKLGNDLDCDHAILLVMEELQDFTTGRVAVQESGKTLISSMAQGKCNWEEQWS
jgi:hypothetical protein